MSSNHPVLLWFRQDLRLSDNPALSVAVATGQPVIPVYIHDTEGHGDWPPGGAAQWWLHHSLSALAASLEARGSQLILRSGRARDVLCGLIAETGASGPRDMGRVIALLKGRVAGRTDLGQLSLQVKQALAALG